MSDGPSPSPASGAGFWAGYWKSLKPLAVEEPIDVWIHRPLAYVLARACMPTPISPNLITLASIACGIACGLAYVSGAPGHMQRAGLWLFASAVLDCADGQLARLRGTSSKLGRMLDGSADLVVSVAAVGGAMWVLVSRHSSPPWLGAVTLAAAAATAVTGSFQTTMYDHYKNVFLNMTTPQFREAEDYASALARYRDRDREHMSLLVRMTWPVYLFYVKSQEDYVRKFDPFTPQALGELPPFSSEGARIYEEVAGPAMRLWRGWFGFGSLVFGIAVSSFLDVLELYMLARLVLQNAAFYGYLRPRQQRASREAFSRIEGLKPAVAASP